DQRGKGLALDRPFGKRGGRIDLLDNLAEIFLLGGLYPEHIQAASIEWIFRAEGALIGVDGVVEIALVHEAVLVPTSLGQDADDLELQVDAGVFQCGYLETFADL